MRHISVSLARILTPDVIRRVIYASSEPITFANVIKVEGGQTVPLRLSGPGEGRPKITSTRVVRLSVLFIESVWQEGGLEAEDHVEHIFL